MSLFDCICRRMSGTWLCPHHGPRHAGETAATEPAAESFAEQSGDKPVCNVDVVTYTMQQAIDKIVGGLRLEWVASPITDYCRAVTVMGKYYTYADRWIDIFDNEFPCESMDHAKELCLRDYKSRFRSGIEKAVKL